MEYRKIGEAYDPTIGGTIGRKFDPETGTGFWEFKD
jgi:hypothetical protein